MKVHLAFGLFLVKSQIFCNFTGSGLLSFFLHYITCGCLVFRLTHSRRDLQLAEEEGHAGVCVYIQDYVLKLGPYACSIQG